MRPPNNNAQWTIQEILQQLNRLKLEHLHAAISVSHKKPTISKNAHALRRFELSRCLATDAELSDELAVELAELHAVVVFVAHDERAIRMKSEASWTVELSGPITALTEDAQKLAIDSEHLCVCEQRYIHMQKQAVHLYAIGLRNEHFGLDDGNSLRVKQVIIGGALQSPLAHEATVALKHLHTVIVRINHIQ